MGCSCTKGEVIGPGKNGLERRRNSSNIEPINVKTSNKPSGIFRRLSLKNFFKENSPNKDATTSRSEMIPSENKSNTIALEAGFLAPSSIAVKIQTTPLIQDRSKIDGNSVYSFYSLPFKTQYLLNAQNEFDSEFANYVSTINNCKTNYLKDYSTKTNINKEIKIYLSTSTSEQVEMFSIFNSFQNDNINDEFLENLNSYCLKDFDLSLINFNTKFNQVNKYYRRLLSKLIINDLLSISSSPSNYSSPGYFVFIIILSNCEFNNELSILCPDEIELKDFELYISKDFNEQELSLFNKWYQIDKNENYYKLNLVNNNNNNNLSELDDLLNIFISKYTCNLTETTAINNEYPQFCFKYLKSIQENEINLVVNHIDPSAIVWLNLTDLKMNEMTRFNQLRFQAVLKLLQSHVLTHNYKECRADSILDENILNKFLFNSTKSLIDQFVEDMNKRISANIVLKIDQNLSDELLKHYEIYKYLRIKYEYSNKQASRVETNSKFVMHLTDYLLANKSVKYPLIVNNFKETCDEIISKWISDTIASSTKKNNSIIYRFCGHSILASDISTLFQSIFHQICYLLNIHESWSFDNVSNIIDNLSKALDANKKDNKDEECIVIFIDRIDRLLHSKYEQNILVKLLDKIYNNNSSLSSNLKLIITFSTATDQFLNLIQTIKDLFKNESFIHSINDSKSNDFNFSQNLNKLKENLYSLFKENNLVEANKLIDVLIDLVTKSRYGLKQKEIFDLLRIYNKKYSICTTDTSFNYSIQVLWYTFKNYSNIFTNQFNLIETLVENNQILYKIPNKFNLNDDLNIKELLNDYFKSNLNSRAYQELSNVFITSERDVYLKSFIINYNWFLKKQQACRGGNVLYFMQDLECFKSVLNDLLNHSQLILVPVENEKDDFKLFEHLFYKTMYALHQDPNQIYDQFKTYLNLYIKQNESNKSLHLMLSNLENHFKEIKFLNPLNLEYIIENEVNKLDKEKISFNNLKKDSTYLSKVVFLNSNTILALSDTQNEIKIWKINETSIELVRSIKLNKTPRDLRLLNQKIAVILVDRNLHLFDLNEAKHILDMNTTMSEKVPFFEIHDQNHVVLLARNRLSVILMKVTAPKDNEDASSELTVKQPSTTTKNYSVDDDMFLFKVGEDRYLNSLLVSKNGQVMVCGDEVQKPFPLLVWNLNKRKLVYDLRQAKHEFITSIQSIGSSGKFVVCACQEEGELKNCFIVYDLMTGQLFKKLKAKSNYVAVEISEEFNVLIACLDNAQIIVYDLTNGSEKCIIDSNRFPINNIEMLDTKKNIFITYDTKGYDWTIRVWDLTKLETNPLVSSFTCPTRIVSCSINVNHFNANTMSTVTNSESFIGLALYGIQQPLILKLNTNSSTLSPVISSETDSELFNRIEQFNKEINL